MAKLTKRDLQPGVYAATMTFFHPETHDLDLDTLKKHIVRLADSGLAGIIALGSNGEAPHLDSEERKLVIQSVVQALESSGHSDLPVVVGASAQSVRGTIELCHEAKQAGGSHVLVLPPSYFTGAMTPDVIYRFYMEVAAASPLPVVLYSFPAVTAGIQMDSDLLIRISKGHPNIVGTKFTCGDTGKLARVARAMETKTPSQPRKPYWAVGGLADFSLQALVAGASGIVAGGANILPKTIVKVYNAYKEGNFEEAIRLQSLLAEGDGSHTAMGIGGTKVILQNAFGYGGPPRRPLQPVSTEAAEMLAASMKEVINYEKSRL